MPPRLPQVEGGQHSGRHERPAAHEETILVIDDDPAVRDLMSRYLIKSGFHAVTAADGEEGLGLPKKFVLESLRWTW